MPTVTAPDHKTLSLAPGETMTVTADGVSSGTLVRLGDSHGAQSQTFNAIAASGSLSVGPYSIATRWDVIPTAGTLTFTLNGAFPSGYRITRSATPLALDGSNPTSAAHGLTTCIAAFAQLVGSSAPGVSTCLITTVINGANIDFYAWKPTSSANTTLIASTGTETFHWFAIGT